MVEGQKSLRATIKFILLVAGLITIAAGKVIPK
jgi:hypothetical protein